MKLVCKICGKEIEKDKEQYTIREFLKHLKNEHNIDKEDYIVKYELNGKHPQCACGCGNPVKIAKGWNVWKKYYKDHKNHMKNSDEIKNKISKAALKRKLSGYYDKIMTDEEINNSFDDFYNGKLTLSEISKKYNHDKRTIKRIWLAKNKINEREYEKIAYRNNFSIGANKRFKKYNENLKYYEEIYDFILANKFKYTINEINEIFGKKMTQTTLLNHLIKLFGEDISTYLVYGYKSKEELFFLNILSFYFGKSNVKYGFNVGGKIFDCLLFNKILLEYDGKYYHNNELSKKNDLEKNKIAHDNGYILIRCNEKSVKNIDFLKKIEEWKNMNL